MKTLDNLETYVPNVTCPYCQDESDISQTCWVEDDLLHIYQKCDICNKVWEEQWTLGSVIVAETDKEEEEYDHLHRHPEAMTY